MAGRSTAGDVGDCGAAAAGGGKARETEPYCLLHKITGDNILVAHIHHTNVTRWHERSLLSCPEHMGTPSCPQRPHPPVARKFLGGNGW